MAAFIHEQQPTHDATSARSLVNPAKIGKRRFGCVSGDVSVVHGVAVASGSPAFSGPLAGMIGGTHVGAALIGLLSIAPLVIWDRCL